MSSITTRLIILCTIIVGVTFVAFVIVFHASTTARFVELEVTRQSPGTPPEFEQFAKSIQGIFQEQGWAGLQNPESTILESGPDWIAIDNDFNVLSSSDPGFSKAVISRDDSGAILLKANSGSEYPGAEVELTWVQPFRLRNQLGAPVGWLLDLPQVSNDNPMTSPADTAETFASGVWRSAAVWLGLLLVLTIASISWLMKRSLLPIERLKSAAGELQRGKVPAPLANPGTREFDELITTFNQATEAIGQTEELRRTLIANVAHELRTPVTNIKAQLEALDAGLIQPEECSPTLQAETRVLERLIDDFQQLAVTDAGQLQLNIQDVPLRSAIENTVVPLADRAKAELILDIPESILIRGDFDRLHQVFGNLMENAVSHRKESLEIRISGNVTDDQVQVRFADNGPGIAEPHRAHVFDRFYRAEQSRNRLTGGSGLGLTIVKGIMEAMGGEIRLSESSAVGAEFILSFPPTSFDSRQF